MASLSSVTLALSRYMAIRACSAATALERRAARPDGTVSNGVISYSASDFHEMPPDPGGGTLQVSTASDAGSFDIHALLHGNIQWMGRILFNCLVYQDEKAIISPWLARSRDISEDGKTCTFLLRDDVTFSDGEAFNAAASQANLEHMRDPSTRSPLAASSTASTAGSTRTRHKHDRRWTCTDHE